MIQVLQGIFAYMCCNQPRFARSIENEKKKVKDPCSELLSLELKFKRLKKDIVRAKKAKEQKEKEGKVKETDDEEGSKKETGKTKPKGSKGKKRKGANKGRDEEEKDDQEEGKHEEESVKGKKAKVDKGTTKVEKRKR